MSSKHDQHEQHDEHQAAAPFSRQLHWFLRARAFFRKISFESAWMPQVSRPKRPGGVSEFKKFECNEERQNACARISGGPYISMVLSTKFLMVFCMKVLRVVLAKHEVWHFYVDWRCICLSKSKIWSPKCAVFARPLPMCISVFFCC